MTRSRPRPNSGLRVVAAVTMLVTVCAWAPTPLAAEETSEPKTPHRFYDDGGIDRGADRSDGADRSATPPWPSPDLTFFIHNTTPDIADPEPQRTAIVNALSYWASVTPLEFTEAASAAGADLVFSFGADTHGSGIHPPPDDGSDGVPFDGAGGTLAHAFLPRTGDPLSGDVHFDEDETWAIPIGASGIHLETVAAHEVGHAIGLRHLNVSGALMAPVYTGGRHPSAMLSTADIEAIEAIYGPSGIRTVPDAHGAASGATTVVAAPGVLANDVSTNGLPLTATVLTEPEHGDLVLRPDGSFDYTHLTGQLGPDAFTYVVTDGVVTSLPVAVRVEVGPSFTSDTVIDVPGSGTSSGPAAPSPSTVTVDGLPPGATITDLDVVFNRPVHSYVSDIDVLLVAPDGTNAVIFSDVRNADALDGSDVVLDDESVNTLGAISEGTAVAGRFRPVNHGTGDAFVDFAGTINPAAALSVFDGIDPTGTWELYVSDDTAEDQGRFDGGFSLVVSTDATCGLVPPTTITHPDGGVVRTGQTAEVIMGLRGPDRIFARGGDDVVCAGGGDDEVFGGAGADTVLGEAGNDTLRAQDGDDDLQGGDGDDELVGGSGNDRLDGGTGVNTLRGQAGADVLVGLTSSQTLAYGGSDDDRVDVGTGDDLVLGGGGHDTVHTGAGDDEVSAGAGDDHVFGQHGDDFLHGRGGDDHLDGGGGNDEIEGGPGDDDLFGRSGDDALTGGGGAFDSCDGGIDTDSGSPSCETEIRIP